MSPTARAALGRAEQREARHFHYDQDKWFYVREGEFLKDVGSARLTVRLGDSVRAPRHVPPVWTHASTPGAHINHVSPRRTHGIMFRIVTQTNAMPPQNPEVPRAYGMELLDPPVAV